MTTRQHSKNVLRAHCFLPGTADRCARQHMFPDRDQLFADQDAEQAHQRHQRRRRRANVENTIDNTDQKTRTERYEISFHGLGLAGIEQNHAARDAPPVSEACSPKAHFEKRTCKPYGECARSISMTPSYVSARAQSC